jgi:putative intracellular protease/amidase
MKKRSLFFKTLFFITIVLLAGCSTADSKNAISDKTKKILIVVSNPSVATTTGWPVGFWAAELTHAYYEFKNAGFSVTIASPRGGKVLFDAYSDPRDKSGYSKDDRTSLQFINTPELMDKLNNTPAVSAFSVNDFDAIVVAGGQAPMFTFKNEKPLQKLFLKFYESGKISAAFCHGTSLLLHITLSNGTPFLKGKTITGFTNEEEDYVDKAMSAKVMPFRIEDEAKKLGANFVKKEPFTPYAVKDGNLITGQQQNSGKATAEIIIKSL